MKNQSSEEILFEAKVLSVEDTEEGKMGVVEYCGVKIEINLSLVPESQTTDIVLVQGRFALARIENSHEIR
jgi:hydrogenase maturation factor